jgi:HNH endonuclease
VSDRPFPLALRPEVCKWCTNCGQPKPLFCFRLRSGERGRRGQRTSWCTNCEAAKQSLRYHADLEKSQQRMRELYAQNPGRAKERQLRYRSAHPERVRESARKSNPVAKKKSYQKNAPWVQRAREKARRRSRFVRRVREDPNLQLWLEVIDRDPCSYCGSVHDGLIDKNVRHWDHIIPESVGGVSEWDNLTGACSSCNPSKRDKPLLIFLLQKVA